MLSRLIYISQNQIDPANGSSVKQLGSILSASNRNNRAKQVTGALIFDEMWFLQALEGDRQAIWSKFQRLMQDERHSDVILVEMVEIDERMFGNWWMGFATRTAETEHLFAPYVHNHRFHPETMRAAEILDMMRGFAELGAHREVVRRVA